MATIEELDFEIEQLGYKQDELLRRAGWEHSCKNPLSVWLWEKDIYGKRMTLPRDLALRVQQRLEELGDASRDR